MYFKFDKVPPALAQIFQLTKERLSNNKRTAANQQYGNLEKFGTVTEIVCI